MIPKKNLFAGALGKLKEIGGSRGFSTPHTVDVPVQYQVNSNLPGDFVTCSLDGRLWCLKRATRFTFFALKWNPDSKKLEFATSVTRINENILARGLDWILTAKVLVKVLDDSPYITTFNLFSDSSVLTLQEGQIIAHCYSVLPKIQQFKVFDDFLTSVSQFDDINHFRSYLAQFKDIDDFLNAIRQFDDFNVSLDFFKKFNSINDVLTFVNNLEDIDSLLNFFQNEEENIEDSLTLLGEFQIIENLLVRRDNNDNMLSRLIPVEFWQNKVLQNISLFNDELSLSISDNHIIAHNGRLWGTGKYALGKVFLLPAVFDPQGKAITFYLYFQHEHNLPRSPQFLRLLIDDLANLTVAAFEGHSFALIKKSLSWKDAYYDCIAKGGHLATATSKEKNDFLVHLADSTSVWLGGVREYPQNNWKWVTGEEWNYENWADEIISDYHYSYLGGYGIILDFDYNLNNAWTFEYARLNYNGGTLEYHDRKNFYICEWDSLDVYDTYLHHMNDEPDSFSLAPAFLGDNLYGYKFNSGHNLCSMSDDNFILNPVAGEWTAVSEHHNGNIHFDINQSKAVSLDDKGANLLHDDNVRFDCCTLNQWLAPANSIDALDNNIVMSSGDNLSVVTHPNSGFMREALHNKILPMSSPLGNGYRFSLGHSTNSSNRKIIDVNMIESNAHNPQPVLWNNIYRQALDIELVNVVRDSHFGGGISITHWDNFDFYRDSGEGIQGMTTPFFCRDLILSKVLTRKSDYKDRALSFESYPSAQNYVQSADVVTEASVNVYYIDPADGNIRFFDNIQASFDDYDFYHYPNAPEPKFYIKNATFPKAISIVQGKIGFGCIRYYLDEHGHVQHTEEFFVPVKDIPDNLLSWSIPNRIGVHYSSGKQGIVLDKIENSYAQFHETSTNLNFALSCHDAPDINYEVASFACQEPYINLDSVLVSDKKKFKHSIHIAGVFKSEHQVWIDNKGRVVVEFVYDSEGNVTQNVDEVDWNAVYSFNAFSVYDLYVFRSTLHNDFFNFDSELKRSVPS